MRLYFVANFLPIFCQFAVQMQKRLEQMSGCPYKYFVKINLSFIVLTHVTVVCCQFDVQMQKRLYQMNACPHIYSVISLVIAI